MSTTSAGTAPAPGALAASRYASLLWTIVALHLVNLLLILREISGVLARIELQGYQSFGMSALTGWHWLPWDYKEMATALVQWDISKVAKWDNSKVDLADSWARWYLFVDLILVISLTVFFYLVIKRLQAKGYLNNEDKLIPWVPLVYGVVDCVENLGLWLLVSRHTSKSEDVSSWLAPVTAVITDLKWITFVLCIIIIIVGLLYREDGKSPWWATTVGGLSAVRVPAVGVLFLFFLLVVPGGGPLDQLPDILRAQTEGNSRWTLLGSSLALVFLSVAVWLSSLLSIPQSDKSHDTSGTTPLGWKLPIVAFAAVFLILYAKAKIPADWLFQISNGALALLIVLLGGWLMAYILKYLRRTSPSAAGKPSLHSKVHHACGVTPSAEIVASIGRVLAAVVLASGGLALVRAFVTPTLTAPITQQSPYPELYGLIIGFLIIYGAPVLLLSGSVRNPLIVGTTRLRWSIVIVVVGAALAGVFAWRPRCAECLGPEGVICFLFGVGIIFVSLIGASKFSTTPGAVSQQLGFSTRPILLTALITYLVAAPLDDLVRYHGARIVPAAAQSVTTLPDGRPASEILYAQVVKWKEQLISCLDARELPAKALPMVLIAAPGGGIRAAFWTGLALDRISSEPCGREQIFVASGVSGGSVGLATWAVYPGSAYPDSAVRVLEEMSKPGPITQSITAMLLRDIPRGFLGIHPPWRDRAAVLEDAWANAHTEGRLNRGWDSVRNPSFATWTPHLILNATDIQRGCRILMTTLPREITVPKARGEKDNPDGKSAGDCASPTQGGKPELKTHFAVGSIDARDFPGQEPCADPPLPSATRRIITAALLSARFPYVSPTGGLVACPTRDDDRSVNVDPDRVLSGDGGYRDNTGLTTLLEFWNLLEPAIAQSNVGSGPPVVPVFVLLDNHYRSSDARGKLHRKVEFLAPLQGRSAMTHSVSPAVLEQSAASISAGALPGLLGTYPFGRWHIVAPRKGPGPAAPLGWVLSNSSQQRLKSQIDKEDKDKGWNLLKVDLDKIRNWQRPGGQ